jgi:Tfp pilus assembly protein PilE
MGRKQHFINAERGISLSGLILVLAVLGVVAVVAMKVLPAYGENRTIQAAIVKAKADGGTSAEMQRAFEKNAEINGFDAVRGRDLVITRDNGEPEISYAYQKRIPLVSNVSLVIDFAGTTDKSGVVAAKAAASTEQ